MRTNLLKWGKLSLTLFYFLFSSITHAQPYESAPKSLKKWQSWVLKDVPDFGCPSSWNSFEERICEWPGELRLIFNKTSGRFQAEWTLFKSGQVELPGSEEDLWPINVKTSKGDNLIVTKKEGRPVVDLPKGKSIISGQFEWRRSPTRLSLPEGSALIDFSYNGRRVNFPEFDPENRLVLKQKSQEKSQQKENLQLRVFRKVSDNIPAQMEIYLELNIGGGEREAELRNPIPKDFIAMEISSSLETSWNEAGNLRVRLRPGQWSILVKARSQKPLDRLSYSPLPSPYPQQEIWVFEAKNDLRVVNVTGAEQIDGQRAQLPPVFSGLPAYLMTKGKSLEVNEKSRGLSFVGNNKIQLRREMWLDFEGKAFTVKDSISGVMKKGWRLDMGAPYYLGSASTNGKNQVITNGTQEGLRGLELRKENISLETQSRLSREAMTIENLGWRHDFERVTGTMHLPPGHRALWLKGPDQVKGTWLSQWSLLNLFLVLILSVGIYKLKGMKWGAIAFFALVLMIHEEGAPTTLWLHLLAALALERALVAKEKFSKAVRFYRLGTLFVLLTVAFPFIVKQVQMAIYPSLEGIPGRVEFYSNINYSSYAPAKRGKSVSRSLRKKAKMAELKEEESIAELAAMNDMAAQADFGGSGLRGAPAPNRVAQSPQAQAYAPYEEYDPKAVVQTGPGLPSWKWGTLTFHWDGPVSKDQQLNLMTLGPWMNRVVVLLRLIFLGLLIFCLLDWESLRNSGRLRFLEDLLPSKAKLSSFIFFLATMGLLGFHSQKVRAQDFPPESLLKEYRQSLLKAPECYPQCGLIDKAQMVASSEDLQIRLGVHMAQDGFIPLPGSFGQWLPQEVFNDGKSTVVRRHSNGLVIALSKGVHTIVMKGELPSESQVQLRFPLTPLNFTYQGRLWSLDGLDSQGKVGGTLTLIRKSLSTEKKKEKKVTNQVLPAFLKIERIFIFGVKWKMNTIIRRMNSSNQGLSFELPKLAGESILSSQVIDFENKVKINLDKGQRYLSYESLLTPRESFNLKASQETLWVETWQFIPSNIWKVDLETEKNGLVSISNTQGGRLANTFRPWPGEGITIKTYKPMGASGKTISLLNGRWEMSPGKRLSRHVIELSFLTSKGLTHDISFPEGATLDEVKIEGREQPLSLKENKLSLPLGVGKQSVSLIWHMKAGITSVFKNPNFDVGLPGINLKLEVRTPQDRWILALGGPVMGPAVLFWGKLLTLLFMAFLLARLSWCPLNFGAWAVLFIGLTQASGPGLYWVAATLLFLSGRKKWLLNVRPWLYNCHTLMAALMVLVSAGILLQVLQQGLLGGPLMDIAGNGSDRYVLHWFVDRYENVFPKLWILSAPQWIYQVMMLIWAIWMSLTVVRWLPWLWEGLYGEGFFKPLKLSWKKKKE